MTYRRAITLKQLFQLYCLVCISAILSGCSKMEMINFKQLTPSGKQNTYLMCPVDYCNIKADATSPIYQVNVDALKSRWDNMIANQPRTKLIASNNSTRHYQYVQRTKVFRFPDYIDVEFIPLNETSSTIAIYSRAKYGYYDFKVNEERVKSWVEQLG